MDKSWLKRAAVLVICLAFLCGCTNNKSTTTGQMVGANQSTEDTKDILSTEENNSENAGTNQQTGNNEEDLNNSSKEQSATIVMVGDVLLHTPVSESGQMADGSYQYNHLFRNAKADIESADLALVNQEVILGGRELGLTGYPAFNGAYEVGDALVNTGFDVILHATNHALDRGKEGLINCMNYWKTSHPDISVVGINDSAESQDKICVRTVNGIRIAILNYTYGTNGILMPSSMPYAVNILTKDKVAKDVEAAKQVSDFIIVAPHWGTEYTHEETEMQKEWAEYFAEIGVNLVIGTHPHVIEPVEWVQASNGNKTLVYYSLGNFINATSDSGEGVADRMVGAMSKVTIRRQTDGSVGIDQYGVIPLVTQMKTGPGQITTYKLSDYTQELAAENEIKDRDDRFSLDFCKQLSKEVFGDLVD